jgi:uncharacterized membrane protein YfhO
MALLDEPPPAELSGDAPSSAAADSVRITEYAADHVRLEIDASAPGLLVLSDTDYPAWQARLDGAAARVYAADGALRAMSVPGGRHSVEFQYASAALPLGAAITSLTVLALVVASVWPRREC